MLPREQMDPYAIKWRDLYAIKPDAPFIQREFGFYSLERWATDGKPHTVDDLAVAAKLEPSGKFNRLAQLGWCEAGFDPIFPEKVLEDKGKYELVQDFAGRNVLCFKGRRNGFMPEYVDHPVKNLASWEKNCAWRMNPDSEGRWKHFDREIAEAVAAAKRGMFMSQGLVGGYMYLRSLIGPEALPYMFYDDPDLIHRCMEAWFTLADQAIARYQAHITLDELFIAEDICYNHGSLISPDMMREFLFPYYRELLKNIKKRQLDPTRHLYFQVDTDGDCRPVIPLYMELGMDVMSPFEVASGCDVVEIGRQYPHLVMTGGVDKRVLAAGKAEIDAMVDRIFPAMKARGGYTPTCDHGVPEEVSYEDWLYFRKRCQKF